MPSMFTFSTLTLMKRCDGGPDETERLLVSANTLESDSRAARTFTGPGMDPEKTDTVARPWESVVVDTGEIWPVEFRPTPPGFVTMLNCTGTLVRGVLPERTLNVTSACSSAPEPDTKICDGLADTKVMAFATG